MLADRFVRDLPAPPLGATITYDGGDPKRRVSGFGVRVTAAGVRAFVLNYRARGIERRYTIDKFPEWNVSRTRDRAKELKRMIDQGGDPLLEEREEREAPTVNDLADRFLSDHAIRKRERSRREDESLLNNGSGRSSTAARYSTAAR